IGKKHSPMSEENRSGVEARDHLTEQRKTEQAKEKKNLKMDEMACGRRMEQRTMCVIEDQS
ncbi:MAG TPA: hypothetical protein VLA60_02515, partial [Nitrospirales bacterium]|nr:hypothetical protein [Nitrospirales bacterium]